MQGIRPDSVSASPLKCLENEAGNSEALDWLDGRKPLKKQPPSSISELLQIPITTTARETASRAILGREAWTTRLGMRIPRGIHRPERGSARPGEAGPTPRFDIRSLRERSLRHFFK